MRKILSWFLGLLSGSSQSSGSPTENSAAVVPTTLKRRYEILLPLTHNDGSQINPEKFFQTYEDVIERFGAFSLNPAPVRGEWLHQGQRYHDQSWRLVVDVPDQAPCRQFFVDWKQILRERF